MNVSLHRGNQMLGGTWEFELDPYDKGLAGEYYLRKRLDDTIQVPGCWQTQHKRLPDGQAGLFSRPSGQTQFKNSDGEYLAPNSEYFGTAWYALNLAVPESAKGREIWLVFPGIHAKAEVWLDGVKIACHEDGPFLPLRIRITGRVRFGQEQRLAIRFCEECQILQGVCKYHFRGLWRAPFIEYTGGAIIGGLFVYGDPFTGDAEVEAEIEFPGGRRPLEYRLFCRESPDGAEQMAGSGAIGDGGLLKTRFTIKDALPWSPEAPNLYCCRMEILEAGNILDEREIRFGFRVFETRGTQILLNGKPVFLRGCGEASIWQCGDYAPATDKGYIEAYIGKLKEYGFNWFRVHTGPTLEEGLDIADEKGLLFSQELFLTLWETDRERSVTRSQWTKIIKRLRNHPCIWIWSMGNEMDCTNPLYSDFVAELYHAAKEISPQTLVTTSDGISRISFDEQPNDVFLVDPGTTLGSVFDIAPLTRVDMNGARMPVVVHELGYVESIPHPRQFGLPGNMEQYFTMNEMIKIIKKKGISDGDILKWSDASERISAFCCYMGLENLRKVDGLAGYNLWGFIDGIGERGGFIDPWMHDKTGMTPEIFNRANGVAAISMTPYYNRYTLFDGEDAKFSLHVSNHGGGTLAGTLRWRLRNGSETLDEGGAAFSADPVRVADIKDICARNPARGASAVLLLEAWIDAPGGKIYNEWRLWSFARPLKNRPGIPVRQLTGMFAAVEDRPSELFPFIGNVTEPQILSLDTSGVLLVNALVSNAVDFLIRGGRLVYCPCYYFFQSMGLPSLPSNWNTLNVFFVGEQGGFGNVVNAHEVLVSFPHDGWADYNFYDLMSGSRARASAPFWSQVPGVFDLDAWPVAIDPIIRSVGYATNLSNRGYMFEARVGEGRLFAVSLRLYETLGTHPESQNLFDAIVRYAASDAFDPKPRISGEEFRKLVKEQYIRQL